MSLRIWLPLLGNLNNNGLENITVTNNNCEFFSGGKIGNCCSFGGSSTQSWLLGTQNFLSNDTEDWTYCCWMKVNGQHNGCLFSCRTNTSPNGISLFYYGSQWYIDDGVRWQFTPQYTIESNKWYHICIVRKKNSGKYLYVNGLLDSSTTTVGEPTVICTTNFAIGNSQSAATYVTANWFNGSLNDVRVYDHALSIKEIKEISKGLVCHYPLNGIGANENLFDFQSIASKWVQDGANAVDYEDDIYGNVLKVTATGNDKRIYRTVSNVWNQNQIYTVSFLAKADEEVSCNMSRSIANYSPNFTLSTEWKRYYGQITSTVTASGGTLSFTILSTDIPVYITQVKLELGDKVTPYLPGVGDSSYVFSNIDNNIAIDISGYGNNGTNKNVVFEDNSPRYNISSKFNGSNGCVAIGRGGMVKDEITITGWFYSDDWTTIKRLASCTETGGWCYGWVNSSAIMTYMGTGTSSNTYKTVTASVTLANMTAGWHMITTTYDGFVVKLYIDTVLVGTNNAYSTKTPIYYNATNGIFIAAEASGNQTTPAGEYSPCNASDFRIYATALSEDDIKELYNVASFVSKSGKSFSYEFEEDNGLSIVTKNGIVKTNFVTEYICNIFDKNVYVEPDGSTWIRIFHHNNPAGGSFSSTDTFASQVYIDENRWFNVSLCNLVSDNWELMIKQKAESTTATESKFRWIQTANPMTATYEQTLSANVTKISTAGYTVSSFGGAYYKNGSADTYIACNNANAGNWWGAIGSYKIYQGGIPAYNGVLVKTGYCDLYLRIDNMNLDKFTIGKDFITTKEIIEI